MLDFERRGRDLRYSIIISFESVPSCDGRVEIKGGKDCRLRAMLRGMIRNDDFECHKNVPKMCSQYCHHIVTRKFDVANRLVLQALIKYLYVQIIMFLFKAVFSFLFV